ncbi:hypothetical protein NP511_02120 [Natrinema thermotolerans]|uniref:Uncharacterized protein n=1 Tax=Natrinema thermotolerans TaxID=121872 RepID=A0AAF0PA67_9EURY|nr:hypothetical protein [Natrinema thermotolerans]WPH65856.1 hypothetical protein HJTV4_gp33 [Haloarchaeal virus HJTV-4]QCC60761.1 hypothetical protein DVR14_19810 [Natrinema thermotolerans]QCC61639.1 hypothetical protein DVR14_23940 [Natrinema thermotolerans]WMT07807.1 hypothetical protein NP511_20835 [Natrinema thermotolerans]WMT08439.1 hypothetical protein NP511_02120 [Natrinema thermotolerans]
MSDDAPDVVVDVPLERPFYDLLRLEVERDDTGYETVEDLLKNGAWRLLSDLHSEFETQAEAPVGVSDEAARRMLLRAEFKRQTREGDGDLAWWDVVNNFVQVDPVILDESDEEVRPDWMEE